DFCAHKRSVGWGCPLIRITEAYAIAIEMPYKEVILRTYRYYIATYSSIVNPMRALEKKS
ncbi:MAG: hypothetical protein WC482_04105, partial [Candidatus Omnitrophota bacterium]